MRSGDRRDRASTARRQPAHPTGREELTPDAVQLLERRAQRLRQPRLAEAEEDDGVLWVAKLPVGDETWALPLASVRAVVLLKQLIAVPLAPGNVVGIFRFEGEIVVAHSSVALLETAPWATDPRFLLVLQGSAGRRIAIDTEQVPMASTLTARSVTEAHVRPDGLVREVLTASRELVRLIDVETLLARKG